MESGKILKVHKQLKVLFLTNIPAPYRVEFFEELGKMCALTVLYERKSADNREWTYAEKANYMSVFMKGIRVGADTALCLEVLTYLKKTYDVIVVGGYSTPTGMLAIEYLKLRKIPFYLNCDGGFVKSERKWNYLVKRHFIKSASYWLSSGKEANKYLIHYGAAANKVFTYPFSSVRETDVLKQNISHEDKISLKKQLGITEEKVVISVGQFIYRKGFDVLLKASAKLKDNVGVYIIGGRPTEAYLHLAEMSQGAQIHFIGFSDKETLKQYYRAADCMAFPTREDIWGLVINEALSNGVPIVSTDRCIAALELVNDAGFIIPSGDEVALYDAVCSLIYNIELQQNMSKNALKNARVYTIEKMANVHMKIFESNL